MSHKTISSYVKRDDVAKLFPKAYALIKKAEAFDGVTFNYLTVSYDNAHKRPTGYKFHMNVHRFGYTKWHPSFNQPDFKRWLLTLKEELESEPRPYIISVCRTSYAFRDIKVTATSQKEAEEMALNIAGSYEFCDADWLCKYLIL